MSCEHTIGCIRIVFSIYNRDQFSFCLLYTSDAADERSSVDLGGRRIIKKKKKVKIGDAREIQDV